MQSDNIKKIIPIILAGGTGSRLWPLSRKSFPKQFLNLLDDQYTMLQKTYKRIENLDDICRPIVICNEEHRFIVGHQMKEINVEPLQILLEPEGRNTAPAIAVAALKALDIHKGKKIDPILLILSSDHQIEDIDKFQLAIKNSIDIALQDNLVIFGIPPTHPAIGYGYIKSDKPLDHNKYQACKVDKFIEKPVEKTAKYFIKDKKYSWNSGIFLFKASVVLEEVLKFEPEIFSICSNSLKNGYLDLDFQRLDAKVFENCKDISFDKGVMEKTKLSTVLALDVGWSDVGSWDSLWKISDKDNRGNVISGNVISENVENCLLKSNERLLVGLNIDNIIVIETVDSVLVMKKGTSEEVKNIVSILKKRNLDEAVKHKKIFRPWGNFFSIAEDINWKVKKICVKPGGALSLQKHNFRSEHWVVVSGKAKVEVDEIKKIMNPNESVYIPIGAKHRLSNPGKEKLIIIEVQNGTYLGEDDIVRFEDIYRRDMR